MDNNQPAPRAHPNKISPALLLFLTFPVMGIIVALIIAGERGRDIVVPGLVNRPAPDFTVHLLSGQAIQLSSLRGRWVFLNFWATWCPPCRQEMPTFQKLLDGGFGPVAGKVTVLAVDALESADSVTAFLNELHLTVPVGLDSDGAVNRLYGVVQLPVTFVIDPTGVIRYKQLGLLTPDLLKEYLRLQG